MSVSPQIQVLHSYMALKRCGATATEKRCCCRSALQAIPAHQSGMSLGSSMSQGSQAFAEAIPETASSMACSSSGSDQAGLLDALLADAMSQDVGDMPSLPADLSSFPGGWSHEGIPATLDSLQLEAEAAAEEARPAEAASRPGSSRESLMAHYLRRGREARRTAHGQS